MHILVNTGGGDAPGLNAVIRAVTLAALARGWKVTGIRYGYEGLIHGRPEDLIPLDRKAVRGISHLGGTILGTLNRGNPFSYPVEVDGKWVEKDISDRVVERFHELKADALIAIGGDGSLTIANKLNKKGIPVVGVPKTIDNDLSETCVTFGFDTAVHIATEAVDRLHSTAESHRRAIVLEVMGRYAGWIALHAGIAGSADAILIPEIPFDIEKVCEKVRARDASGAGFTIIVVAEGVTPVGGELSVVGTEIGRDVQLGGAGEKVAKAINLITGKETRTVVLGHLQRGGTPTAYDRLLALRLGAEAIRSVERGEFGKMVSYNPPGVETVDIAKATAALKTVPLDGDTLSTARELGICLGD